MSVDLSAVIADLENGAADALADTAQALANEANLKAPIGETGDLSRGAQVTQNPSPGAFMTATVENDTPYASFVDEGTGAHPIDGNPFLAFTVGGQRVVVRHVNHPGTSPQPFWTDTFNESTFADQLQASLDTLLQ